MCLERNNSRLIDSLLVFKYMLCQRAVTNAAAFGLEAMVASYHKTWRGTAIEERH